MTHPKTGDEELERLRSIAEAASSAPWHIRTGKNGELDLFILDMKCKYIARMWVTGSHVKQDAEFISAFSPSVVLKMMNDLEAHQSETELLRKRIERLRSALEFYADSRSDFAGPARVYAAIMGVDHGKRAREALEKLNTR